MVVLFYCAVVSIGLMMLEICLLGELFAGPSGVLCRHCVCKRGREGGVGSSEEIKVGYINVFHFICCCSQVQCSPQHLFICQSHILDSSISGKDYGERISSLTLIFYKHISMSGYLLALASAICNGSFAAAQKLPSVERARPHPVIFNSFVCFGVVVSSLIVMPFLPFFGADLKFNILGSLSGVLFVGAILCSFLAIPHLGLAMAQGIWGGSALLVAFLWGVLGPSPVGAAPSSWFGSLGGVVLLFVGILGMVFHESLAQRMCSTAVASGTMTPLLAKDPAKNSRDSRSDSQNFTSDSQNFTSDSQNFTSDLSQNPRYVSGTCENNEWKNTRDPQGVYQGERHIGRDTFDDLFQELYIPWNDEDDEDGVSYFLSDSTTTDLNDEDDIEIQKPFTQKRLDHLTPSSDAVYGLDSDDNPKRQNSQYYEIHRRHLLIAAKQRERRLAALAPASASTSAPVSGPAKSRFLGILYALLTGVFGGSVNVPSSLTGLYGTKLVGIETLPSFGLGGCIAGLSVPIIYFTLVDKKALHATGGLHVQVLWLPGLISGTIWNVGNICSVYANVEISFAVAQPLMQCALLVSGMLGIFVFKEIQGSSRIITFFSFAVILLVGAAMLAVFGPG